MTDKRHSRRQFLCGAGGIAAMTGIRPAKAREAPTMPEGRPNYRRGPRPDGEATVMLSGIPSCDGPVRVPRWGGGSSLRLLHTAVDGEIAVVLFTPLVAWEIAPSGRKLFLDPRMAFYGSRSESSRWVLDYIDHYDDGRPGDPLRWTLMFVHHATNKLLWKSHGRGDAVLDLGAMFPDVFIRMV